jgi:hypothetical protein
MRYQNSHNHDHNMITIDNIRIHVMNMSDGRYKTHYLPYWTYSSLEDLSKDITDMTPRFNSALLNGEQN